MKNDSAKSKDLPDHVFTITIRAPVQRVWDELTRTGGVQRWMVNTILEGSLKPGGKLRYFSPDRSRVFVVGEVVEVSPPHRFSHTFMFTMRPETPTLVTWELKAVPEGCELTLTHAKWSDQAKTHKSVVAGWRDIVALLKQEIETGSIPIRTRLTYALMGALQFMLPKSTRIAEVEKSGW
jgi:uncharacterized protein YndB with AHSA1/START domain